MHPDLIRAQDKNNSKKNENTVLSVSYYKRKTAIIDCQKQRDVSILDRQQKYIWNNNVILFLSNFENVTNLFFITKQT